MGRITVLSHICREDRLPVLHVPRVLRDEMTGAALVGRCIRHTVIEPTDTREMLARIQSTMDMSGLTIPKDDEIANIRLKVTPESSLKRIRFTSIETQKRSNKTEEPMGTHSQPRRMSAQERGARDGI